MKSPKRNIRKNNTGQNVQGRVYFENSDTEQ
jgi:hypothetical protein